MLALLLAMKSPDANRGDACPLAQTRRAASWGPVLPARGIEREGC
jgi:hypothetical protein